MIRTVRYRLYPTCAQETQLRQTLEICRRLYNDLLEIHMKAYAVEGITLTGYQMEHLLLDMKAKDPTLKKIYSQVACDVCIRLGRTYSDYLRRMKAGENPGNPRFKGRNRYASFTYPQRGFVFEGDRVTLSKIGSLRFVKHVSIRGQIKNCTVVRGVTERKWYLSVEYEVDRSDLVRHSDGPPVGIDLGIKRMAALSDGTIIENPKFMERARRRLAKLQSEMSKLERRSPVRHKLRKRYLHLCERLINARTGYLHNVSSALVRDHSVIVMEDLDVSRLTGIDVTHAIRYAYQSVAWGRFRQMLAYKAEEAGAQLLLVDPSDTSKQCSGCGALVSKDLKVRRHRCPCCGLDIDRDVNAAINILGRMMPTGAVKSTNAVVDGKPSMTTEHS